jgi:hypothetical protein
VLGFAPLTSGVAIGGANIFVVPMVGVSMLSTPMGTAAVRIPLPLGIQGTRVFAQFVCPVPGTCALPNALASSNALDITVR